MTRATLYVAPEGTPVPEELGDFIAWTRCEYVDIVKVVYGAGR